jgi:hypothetical protein
MSERPFAQANNCADHIEGGTCFEFQLPFAEYITARAGAGACIYVYDGGGHFERGEKAA